MKVETALVHARSLLETLEEDVRHLHVIVNVLAHEDLSADVERTCQVALTELCVRYRTVRKEHAL